MSFLKRVALLLIALLIPGALFAATFAPAQLLDQAKAASGGDAWNQIRSLRMDGTLKVGNRSGIMTVLEDLTRGRSVEHVAFGSITGILGFDGKIAWYSSGGRVLVYKSIRAIRVAASAAYQTERAWWFPRRWPAAIASLGSRKRGGIIYRVLRITPRGGLPLELWIQTNTYQIARIIHPTEQGVGTTYFSDYRSVDGVKLPFYIRRSGGTNQPDTIIKVQDVTANVPVTNADFAVPPGPAKTPALAPATGDAAFVASFKCPGLGAGQKAQQQQMVHYFQWVKKHHGTWRLNRALEFRYALLKLHDCNATLGHIRHNLGLETHSYAYIADSILPRAKATKNCIRPRLEKLPMKRVDKMQELRDQAEQDAGSLTRLKSMAIRKNLIAEYYLATLYDPGINMTETTVRKNWRNADRWYARSAEGGIAAAQISIGNSYSKGSGVPVNQEKAVHWYRLAAQNGYVDAAWNMGVAYEYGRGVSPSMPQALRWYCAGAMEGDQEAQWHLAAVYYLGEEGVSPNLIRTLYWLGILSKEANPVAPMLLHMLREGMVKEGIKIPQ